MCKRRTARLLTQQMSHSVLWRAIMRYFQPVLVILQQVRSERLHLIL